MAGAGKERSADLVSAAISEASKLLGYKELRDKQEQAIQQFLKGNDVFVSLPTGSGKSLCYWILPYIFNMIRGRQDSMVLVVSPLIAIMQDQVKLLLTKGMKAIYVGGAHASAIDDIKEGNFQVLFYSPECLLTELDWRDVLHSRVFQEQLVGFIMDEAHCVKQWGTEFRKEFSNLGEVRSLIPDHVRCMALTATATKTTRRSICNILGMKPVVVSESPNKPNIKYRVYKRPGIMEETFSYLVEQLLQQRTAMDRVLVFCRTYDDVSHLYLFMKDRMAEQSTEPPGAPDHPKYRLFDMFSSCTHSDAKPLIINEFTKEGSSLRILIATIAFGMGLNCCNLKKVIHWGPPSDIESYIQETGRGGRNGLRTEAVLYYKTSVGLHVSEDMKTYCVNTMKCRRELLFEDFDDNKEHSHQLSLCSCCDLCELKCHCKDCS